MSPSETERDLLGGCVFYKAVFLSDAHCSCFFFFLSQYSCCGLGLTGLFFFWTVPHFFGVGLPKCETVPKKPILASPDPKKTRDCPKKLKKKTILQSLELLPCPGICFFLFFWDSLEFFWGLGLPGLFFLGQFHTFLTFLGSASQNARLSPKNQSWQAQTPNKNSRLSQKTQKPILQSLELLTGPRPAGIAFFLFFWDSLEFFWVWACQDWFFWDSLAFCEVDPKKSVELSQKKQSCCTD